MNVTSAGACSGSAFALVANQSMAQSQGNAGAAAEVRAAKMSQDVQKMAGDVIAQTLEKMDEMASTVDVLA
ncbi:MAG: hypothetical protein ACLFV7_10625 [Phycisphaerae bacterium]